MYIRLQLTRSTKWTLARVDSRWGLLTREATSTEKPLLQRACLILSTRVAGYWTDRDGSDLEAGIVTEEYWVSGVEVVLTSLRVVGTRLPGASVGQ